MTLEINITFLKIHHGVYAKCDRLLLLLYSSYEYKSMSLQYIYKLRITNVNKDISLPGSWSSIISIVGIEVG